MVNNQNQEAQDKNIVPFTTSDAEVAKFHEAKRLLQDVINQLEKSNRDIDETIKIASQLLHINQDLLRILRRQLVA